MELIPGLILYSKDEKNVKFGHTAVQRVSVFDIPQEGKEQASVKTHTQKKKKLNTALKITKGHEAFLSRVE